MQSPSVGAPNAFTALGISKRFGPVTALRDVDLEIRAGEIHALLGENGAGKTTLMNIACGMFQADSGQMQYFGTSAGPKSPAKAADLGIGMVHQHFRLVEPFTVAENVHLGWDQAPKSLSRAAMYRRAEQLADEYRIAIDPRAKIWQLSVAQKQQVAILKALSRGARILVLDEPTAVLTPQEAEALFEHLHALSAAGRSVVLISHKLREVLAVSDRISVLRAGIRAATVQTAQSDAGSLVRLMLGDEKARQVNAEAPTRVQHAAPARPTITVSNVSAKDDRGMLAVDKLSLSLRSGEIVGVASVAGNGTRELVEVLTGLRTPTAGSVEVDRGSKGDKGKGRSLATSLGHIPEETSTGIAMTATIEMNAVVRFADTAAGKRFGALLNLKAMGSHARQLMTDARLAGISPQRAASTLSGGQCQRLIIRRELSAGMPAIVAAFPSRGLDVASAAEVQNALIESRNAGTAVLLLSEDLDELFRISDRILVMYEGRIVTDLPAESADLEVVGMFMTGGTPGTEREQKQ